jgi:hypothetical protein
MAGSNTAGIVERMRRLLYVMPGGTRELRTAFSCPAIV